MSPSPESPASSRQKALAELKKQIAEQRARLDPKLLKLAAQAASLSQKEAAERQNGLVPYDRGAAAEAIRLFLEDHPDSAAFEQALQELIRRSQH